MSIIEDEKEYLLAQSSQDWKWLLEDEGITGDLDLSVDETAATVNGNNNNNKSHSRKIGDALDWLQNSSDRLVLLERKLKYNVTKDKSKKNRRTVLQKQLHDCRDEWQKNIPKEMHQNISTEEEWELILSKFESYLNETVEPNCLRHIQTTWVKYVPILERLLKRFDQIRENIILSDDTKIPKFQTLNELLSSSSRNNSIDDTNTAEGGKIVSSWEDYEVVRTELQQLLSFLQSWYNQVKNPQYSFIKNTLADMKIQDYDEEDNNNKEEKPLHITLDIFLEEIQPPIWWILWNTTMERSTWTKRLQLIHQRHLRLSKILDNEINNCTSYTKDLQQNVKESKEEIKHVKNKLEEFITLHCDFEDSIEILL